MSVRTRINLRSVRRTIRAIRDDESGMLSLMHVIVVLMCLLLMLMLLHVCSEVDRSIRRQDAADAIALGAAHQMERALNAITATNHVIGELTSFLVLHEAVGGTRVGNDPQDTSSLDRALRRARQQAHSLGAATPGFPIVSQRIMSGRTILRAKSQLKRQLSHTYTAMASALADGRHDEYQSLRAQEDTIAGEYQLLNQLEQSAIGLLPMRNRLRDEALPKAKAYTDQIVDLMPEVMRETAQRIGELNQVDGFVVGARIPVQPDPLRAAHDLQGIPPKWYADWSPPAHTVPPPGVPRVVINRRQVVKVTQLTRATFPWVNYHRTPVVQNMKRRFVRVDVAGIYFEETTDATIDVCDRLQTRKQHPIWLYVLSESPAIDKGHERFADDPIHADRHFAVVGVARERHARSLDGSLLHARALDEYAAYAQALVYNANPQRPHPKRIDLSCKRIIPIRQAAVGWDTLNWSLPHGDGPFEIIGKGSLLDPREYPRIRVNWQAMLVPGSQSRTAHLGMTTELPDSLRKHFARMPKPIPSEMLTH